MSTWEERMAIKHYQKRVETELQEMRRLDEEELKAVRDNLLPSLDNEHCAHGKKLGDNSHWEGIGWAGGIATCECCKQDYGYIDFGWMIGTEDGGSMSGGRVSNKHLCYECGGQDRAVGAGEHPPGTQRLMPDGTWETI